MNYLVCANIFETLGLGWEKMLLYFANFVILFLGLTFLLFKPIKKFMAKRQEEIKAEYDAAEEAKRNAEGLKEQYEKEAQEAIEAAQKEAETAREEKEAALKAHEVIIENAKKEAAEIIINAKNAAEAEKKHAVKEAREDVIDIALNIAENILSREITEDENRKLIDECINEWGENE